MNRRSVALVVTLTAAAALGSGGTLARFTHQATIGSNAFTTGSVTNAVSPTSALLTYSNMGPGDSVTNKIVVSNTGTGQYRYAISSTATNTDAKGLRAQLVLTIKTIDVTTPGAGTECDNFDGTQLYSGNLGTTNTKLVGDAAQGSHSGDRTLNASGSETLCFRATLPLNTSAAYQSATTTVSFTFDAEQTANNP